MLESKFQAEIISELRDLFPDCIILKNDTTYIQGIPDLTILYKDRWAMLEVKKNKLANKQPNQEFFINYLNDLSYASFIYPENKEEVFYEIQRAFSATRPSRISRRI